MTTRVEQSVPFTTDHDSEAERQDRESEMVRDESRSGHGEEGTTTFFPKCESESAAAYGLRAAGEILSRYLMDEER